MKITTGMMGVITLMFLFSCSTIPGNKAKEEKIDFSEWDNWKFIPENKLKELDDIVTKLIEVAKAEGRIPSKDAIWKLGWRLAKIDDERIGAISTLADIGNERAIRFLVDNIAMRVDAMMYHISDIDRIKPLPCKYILVEKPGWRIIPYILEALEKNKNDEEINLLGWVLERLPGKRLALAIIQSEIDAFKDDKTKETYISNLNQIKQYIENPGK